MCGIAGFASLHQLEDDAPGRALTMRDVLHHRGPDEAGLWCDLHAALAHRRLSIVDLSTGQQPLSNEDQTIWVIFNGEIYNHAEIRATLQARGHVYRTKSDTETIVHAYEEWGEACMEHFRGMFAFAIWDAPKRYLLLVRDRLGIKPLYWAHVRDTLVFGSEIKAILASGLVAPRAREDRLPELLSTRYVSGDDTLFHGVQKLLPGHLLVFADGQVRIRQYWDVPGRQQGERSTTPPHRGERVVEQFRELLEESIRLRLMSDVPLGMFLSGGIDSSAIAMLMARMIDWPLQTFSVAFEEHAFNELAYARQVAGAIGADRHEVVIDAHDFFGALPKLVWHEDEPLAHPSSVPLFFVSALAREHVKVVLTGEGSDELLAGYGKYPRIAWNWRAGTVYERMIPGAVRAAIADHVVPRLPGQLGRYARRSFLAMSRTPDDMLFNNFSAVSLAEQRRLLDVRWQPERTPAQAFGCSRMYFDRLPAGSSLLDRLLYSDIKTYLVELLMKQDQMSMAASVESRVPFLDHKLVEFAATLPDAWKLSGWTTKRVLRASMKDVLPPAIVRRPKMGFPVPVSAWTRGPWNTVAREILLDRRSRERGIIDPPAVDTLLRDHAAGRIDAGDRIWSLINLELWYRTFIDNEGIQTLPSPNHHANTLAEIGPAAAAGHGWKAPHLAPAAPPREAPSHHVSGIRQAR